MASDRKVEARSANKDTDDWSLWMLWDGELNVAVKCLAALGIVFTGYRLPFLRRADAEIVAQIINDRASLHD